MNLEGKVFAEQHVHGTGYDIQGEAFARLGEETRAKFQALTTSGQIRGFAEEYKGELTEEEYQEFRGYADMIGLLFGELS
jgi:hypothetical protein